MIKWILFTCLFIVRSNGENGTMNGKHITINTRTGLISLSSLPNYARPGDTILICLPPGAGKGCHFMGEEGGGGGNLCMVTHTACHVTRIPDHLPHMASFIVHNRECTFHSNAMQPGSHPLIHCLMMWNNNVHMLDRCVTLLMNQTHHDIVDPMGHVVYETNPGSVHFIMEQEDQVGEINDILTLFFQTLFCFFCVGFFFVHSGLLTPDKSL